MNKALTEEDHIKILQQIYRCSEERARLIRAFETGEYSGDLQELPDAPTEAQVPEAA